MSTFNRYRKAYLARIRIAQQLDKMLSANRCELFNFHSQLDILVHRLNTDSATTVTQVRFAEDYYSAYCYVNSTLANINVSSKRGRI